MTNIKDLPDEVLEFILSLISPYQDLNNCLRVSKRWRTCVHNVVKIRRRNLHRSISDFDVKWLSLMPPEGYPAISKRYSHSAAIHGNSMYVFGGFTCTRTTFNDLWKFDLSEREWVRPLATGTYPSPKACSSMVYYKDMLVLFGGWTYPPSYPLCQSWHLFDELHVYDIEKNHWRAVSVLTSPPATAGHSVSIVDNWMIVFGGLAKPSSAVECEKTNEVWKLNLDDWTWVKQEVEGAKKPEGLFFGQTQVILNDKNIFIIGGSGGSNANYSDAWILNISNDNVWKWIPVEIKGKANKPANIWSNPGCKVDDKIIVLNRMQVDTSFPICNSRYSSEYKQDQPTNASARIDLANRQPDLDENVNGRRGSLRVPHRDNEAGSSSQPYQPVPKVNNLIPRAGMPLAAFAEADKLSRQYGFPMNDRRYEREVLKRLRDCPRRDEWERKMNKSPHFLGLYVLDLKHALDEKPYVTWLPPKSYNKGPPESILYTLLPGKSEVIMCGGIENEKSLGELNNTISNSLYFISAKDRII